MTRTSAFVMVVVAAACGGDSTQASGDETSSTAGPTSAEGDTTTASTSNSGVDTTGTDTTSVDPTASSSSDEGESSSSTGEPLGPPDDCPRAVSFTDASFELPGGGVPLGVALFDADGTGNIDLAVADGAQGRVLVLPGTGGGTFGAPAVIDLGLDPQPQDLLAADVDDDGDRDLLIADMDGQSTFVRLWHGVGDGTFTEAGNIQVGGRPADLQRGDYDGDGTPDFTVQLVENFMPSNVVVLLGVGNGTFTQGAELGVSNQPVAFASGDLDGDGAADLLGVYPGTGEVVLRRNADGGSFGDAGTLVYEPVGNAAIIADLDNDGVGEVVVSSGADDMPGGIHLWAGSATFDHVAPLVLAAETPLDTIVAHDVSGDGWPDLVMGTENSSSSPGLWIQLTDPSGIGACAFTVALESNPRSIAAGDLDGDGDEDLVAALSGAAPSVAVLLRD